MAVPQNRDELLSEIARNYERLRKWAKQQGITL